MTRRSGQSWREYVEKSAGDWAEEVLRDYDAQIANGITEKDAARFALCAWRRGPCDAPGKQ